MSQERSFSDEVQFGFLPVKKSERQFSFWDLLIIQLGIGISCIVLLTGGYTGTALMATDSIAVILFGNALPVLLIIPIAIYFARYGVDTFIAFRSSLGYLGSDLFYALFALTTLGYISIACFMTGQAAINLASIFGWSEFFTSRETGAPFFAIVSFLFAFWIAYKGPTAIKWLNWIGVPAILLVLLGMIAFIVFGQGLNKVLALQPSAPYEDFSRSFATALEWNVGLGFSWLPYIGQYSRLAKTEKVAFSGGYWSYGVVLNVAVVFGAFAALLVASLEPSDWMLGIGGPIWGLIGLVLLIVGNIAAVTFLIYSQAVSFKTVFPKKKWSLAMGSTALSIILMLSPTFYDAFGSFIAVIAYIMSVMGGIVIVDYFFVKKQNISVRDLYNRYGAYKYLAGFNPSAILSLIVGSIFYWSMYNPVADSASGLFPYVTAGLPTYFVSAICFYISSKYLFSYEVDRQAGKVGEKISA